MLYGLGSQYSLYLSVPWPLRVQDAYGTGGSYCSLTTELLAKALMRVSISPTFISPVNVKMCWPLIDIG